MAGGISTGTTSSRASGLGAITQGEWQVRNLLQVDCARRELLIQTAGRTAGRNPYYRDLCRVNIDSGALTTLVS